MKSLRVWVVVVVVVLSLAAGGAFWGMLPRSAGDPPGRNTQPDPTAVLSPQLLPGAAIVPPGFIYGVSVADLKNTTRVKELGFPWMKTHLPWKAVEAKRGQYRWTDLDQAIRAATENNLGLVLRVDRAPEWSHPSNPDPAAPPDPEFLPDFRRFLQIAAARGAGRVLAYEIWNEPNLAFEWGGKPPDPAGYARLLQAGYEGIKAGDPNALVVSAGLTNTEEQSARATDELVFLRAFYQAGAAPHFDVLGYHPHAGPDTVEGAQFRKAEAVRRIMEENGDRGKKMWATELAWIARPPAECASDPRWAGRMWESVGYDEQARYLVDSFGFVRAQWPWMEGIFLFNLDFSLAPWYDACEPMAFESLLERDGAPRLAFSQLSAMPKVSASVPFLPPRLLPAEGPLVKGGCGEIWAVAGGARHWVPDEETFVAGGYVAVEMRTLSDDELRDIPVGSPLPSVKSGKHPDNMLVKSPGADAVYAVQNGVRRLIPSVGAFDANGYCWDNIWEIPEGELRLIPEGPQLPPALQLAFTCESEGNEEICVVNANGTSQRAIPKHPARDHSPAWKPGTDTIAFVSDRDGNSEIYTMTSDGKNLQRITDSGSEDLRPWFSSDGGEIFFISNRGGSYQLWSMGEDGSFPRRVTNLPGDVKGYAFSLDGTKLAVESALPDGSRAVWGLDPDGTGLARLSEPGADAWDAELSADGNVAVYVSGASGKADVYIVGSGGGTSTRLTDNVRWNRLPAWSPATDRIAYLSSDDGREWSLEAMSTEGKKPSWLVHRVNGGVRPAWSGDGDRLAFASEMDGVPEVYVHTTRSTGPDIARVTWGGAVKGDLAWSR